MSDIEPTEGAYQIADDHDDDSKSGSVTNLHEHFNQQQAKISALKQLVRQSEDEDHGKASAQEKVKNIAQRLTHIKSKVTRSRQNTEKSFSEIREEMSFDSSLGSVQDVSLPYSTTGDTPTSRRRSETPASEKIQLLRQQMEQTRLRMAEREASKRDIEQRVTQLKAKFNSSQQSLDRAHLGSSIGDLSAISTKSLKYQSTGDVSGFNLDRERIKYLEKRIKHLESEMKQKEADFIHRDPESEQSRLIHQLNARIMDLEENLKEKDGLIDARTKAANLISESLSLKGKDTVDLLEETKLEMLKMQQNFVANEDELNKRIATLEKEIQTKDKRIANLEEVNDILETARFDLTLKNSELDSKTGNFEDYVNKLKELNKINETLQHRIEHLENEKEQETTSAALDVDIREYVQKIQQFESRIASLESENDDLKKSLQAALNTPASDASDQERISNLEATISAQKQECERLSNLLQTVQEQLAEKTVEYNVLMANFNVLDEKLKSYGPKSLFSKSTDEEAQAEINKLTKQLDEANKSGIKTKLKMKQLQKQLDTFKKASDTNKELVKVMDENQRLSEKIKEIETDAATIKSQQLQSAADDVDSDHNKSAHDLEAKIRLLETTCQNQTSAIQLLEEQKLDMTASLNETKSELSSLKGHMKDKEDVTSEMDSIANEERIEMLSKEIENLNNQIHRLNAEKNEQKSKLDRYISENMELLEKIDKLSKGSSVESIEILERLTQEEKLEMERLHHAAETVTHVGTENRDETVQFDSDKISPQDEAEKASDSEARLQSLLNENQQLLQDIELLRTEKDRILEEFEKAKTANSFTADALQEVQSEHDQLLSKMKETEEIKLKLEQDIARLEKERGSVKASTAKPSDEVLPFFDKQSYATGLKSLYSELDKFGNAKEKNAKVNASKRVARESKNVAELMEKLLASYNSSIEELETYKSEVEGERAARAEHEKHKIEVMTAGDNKEDKIAELQERIAKLQQSEDDIKAKYSDLEQQFEERESSFNEIERSSAELKSENDRLNEQMKELQSSFEETKEFDLQELQKQRKEFDNLLESSKQEVQILRELVDEQKQQLIDAFTEHESVQQQNETQINSYAQQIEGLKHDLRDAQSQMQNANQDNVSQLTEKIESLQALLDENKRVLDEQSAELDNKQSTIESLNAQIMDLYKSMESHATDLAEKDDEIESLQTQIDRDKADIKKMNQINLSSERKAKELDSAVKRKESEWEKERAELEKIRIGLEKERSDLETKNKEQLEKLKKFAANLKKKNAQYAELEAKYNAIASEQQTEPVVVREEVRQVESVPLQQSSVDSGLKEAIARLEQELHESSSIISSLRGEIEQKTTEIDTLKLRFNEKTQHFDECTANLNAKQNEISELQQNLQQLQAVKEELTTTAEDLKSKNIKIEKCKAIIKEKNKEIKRLHELEESIKNKQPSEVSADELKVQLDQAQSEKDKINEDFDNYRSFIETKLQNSGLLVESVETENTQLKERIARLEENISHAEKRRSSLERHSELLGLQLQQQQSQIAHAEDEYAHRLQTLVGQDEIIEQKLKDLEFERGGLLETIKDYETQMNEWTGKNEELEQRIYELESTRLVELEEENQELASRIDKIQAELDRKQRDFDKILAEKQSELAELENELSNHLKSVEKERRSIQENLEKSIEENSVLQDQIVQLQESQFSLELSRTELEKEMTWVKLQNDTMTQDQLEAQELRMQVVQDQTEVDNLHAQNLELVDKHNAEINALHMQLTEANVFHAAEMEKLKARMAAVKEELTHELDTLKTQICEDQTEIVNLRLRSDQMLADHENEVTHLQSRVTELTALYEQAQRDHNEIESLRMHKQQLEVEITVLRQQISALDALQMNVGQNITQDQMEVQQYRLQITQDQTEIESLRMQIQQLNTNHESELAALRQQIAELDSLRMQVGQNQTDDQVFIQNENERLQSLLAEKEMEIQNYQRQNLQLQMSAGAMSNDPFSSFSNVSSDQVDVLTLSTKVSELENRLENTLHEINELQTRCSELQRLCVEKDSEINRLQERNGFESVAVNEPIMSSISQSHQQSLVGPFEIQAPIDGGASGSSSNENHGQQIEDLQRNVSDLEKYVTDLEHKLKAANEEIIKYHVERANFATKTKQSDDELAMLTSTVASLRRQLESIQSERDNQTVAQPHTSQLPSTASLFGASDDNNPFISVTNAFHMSAQSQGQFQPSQGQDYFGQVPVVEEVIVPKKAYICHPEEQQTLSPMNDDWGNESAWGNDAHLEEQHQQQSSTVDQAVFNRAAVNLQLEVDEMKAQRDSISTELTALQTKYQKLMKKLREYKAKIDDFEANKSKKRSSVESNDLDLAIQEELNSQIKALEQKLKEVKVEQDKEGQEKKKLLSRVDVLTAANDRMMEMKDKQDVEIEVCKTKIRELTGKLEKLSEWGDEGSSKPTTDDQLSARLTEVQNHNRVLEERIHRLQESAEKDDFEEERDQYFEQLRVLTAEKVMLEENITIKSNEIAGLHEKLKSLEMENNDYKQTIELLSVESNNIKVHLDQLKDDHKQKIDENATLSKKLTELMDRNAELARQVEDMRVYDMNSQDVEQRIQDLTASIQYKDSEISAFNEKLASQQQSFDQEYERMKKELSNNGETISELRQEISRLMSENEQLSATQVNLASQPDQSPAASDEMRKLEQIVSELREEKANMEAELQVLNDQVIKNLEIEDRIKSTVLELDMKNIEISELKNSLQQLKDQGAASTDSVSQQQIMELTQSLQNNDALHQSNVDLLNAQWQQVVDQKCAEVADSWRQHLQVKEDEFAIVENDLKERITQLEQQSPTSTTTTETQNTPTSHSGDSLSNIQESPELKYQENVEQSERIKTMQIALESQEIEIVSLKEQLAIRSAEYARIAASVDPYAMRSTSSNIQVANQDEPPSKGNELDLALYMLHQRDMRCEELTEEVIHLLEERDTLQLKLSNTIRQVEGLKLKSGTEVEAMEGNTSPSSPVKSNTSNDAYSSQDGSFTEPSQPDNLDLKLSELHKVSHSRDKTLYEDREQRRRQMNLFQQDVANMPPEAIAELFGPNFKPNTRNPQNPSSMLMDWLWGRPNEPQN